MRRRWAWLAAGGGIVATTTSVACGPTETTCEESATCPPGSAGAAGAAGASMIDSGSDASGGDAGVPEDVSVQGDADAAVDSVRPRDDISVTDARDTDARLDMGPPDDTRRDIVVPDAPITDVASEPDACDPGTSKSPVESTCLISEKYGIFVSPQGSDTTGVGTRAAPYKTLVKALQSAKGNVMRVYACDDSTGYPDGLAVDATLDGMSLYGGFECTGWTYATTRRARVHPATGVALTIKGLTVGATVEDFEFDAADAATGASSIGAIVDTAVNVVLRGVKVVAGKGGAGVDGVDGAKGDDGISFGLDQRGFPAQCPYANSLQVGGGWSRASDCGSQGGGGGTAAKNNVGASGYPGTPSTGVTPPGTDNRGDPGGIGGDGSLGSFGDPGTLGLAGNAAGAFTSAGYALAASGGDGAVGHTGQGGGGGGASNAPPVSGCIGASGGAGGMGGCGGLPGTGGASAGASVALLSWMSPITLDRCELTSVSGGGGGKGGSGGKGGAGKDGAPGGAAYTGDAGPAPDAGAGLGKGGGGGPGGNGGNGGSGAGGNGGPSYAVVYKGTAPTKLNGTILAHGSGGTKGMGGSVGPVKAPDGIVGSAVDDFAVP